MDTYTFILKFAEDNLFMAFCTLLGACFFAWIMALIIQDVLNVSRSLVIRSYRAIVVLLRGWPPEHLDADGDWRPPAQQETTTTETAQVGDMRHTVTRAYRDHKPVPGEVKQGAKTGGFFGNTN